MENNPSTLPLNTSSLHSVAKEDTKDNIRPLYFADNAIIENGKKNVPTS
jgi:hypothetical protein